MVPVLFHDIYYRNLDLYSKRLKSSGPQNRNLKIHNNRNSPVECGYSAIHLEEKDIHTQCQRTIPGRTFPNSPSQVSRLGIQPPPSEGSLRLEPLHSIRSQAPAQVRGTWPNSITSHMEKVYIRSSATCAFFHGAVTFTLQTLALLKNMAGLAQRGWNCRETDIGPV